VVQTTNSSLDQQPGWSLVLKRKITVILFGSKVSSKVFIHTGLQRDGRSAPQLGECILFSA
jgi:hypothetical protein